jgi:DNA-binding MarR family transcriptional regulator
MGKPEAERPTSDLAIRLALALSRLRSRLREQAGVHTAGLTLSQLSLLDRLDSDGPATAAALAAAQHVTQQAIAQSAAGLKADGLVSTAPHPTDGRKVLITVTDAGRRLHESMRASRDSWLVGAIDTLMSPEDRASLERTVELFDRLAAAEL